MLRNIATVLAALLIAVVPSALAQSSRPQFEVASVKENKRGGPLTMRSAGGRFIATNVPLILLLQLAYQRADGPVSGSRILGAPPWVKTTAFDIEAKVPGESHPVPLLEMWPRVQTLLEDRFKLKAHIDSREMDVYELTINRGGVKMRVSADQTPVPLDPDAPPLNPYAQPNRNCGGVQPVPAGGRAEPLDAPGACRGSQSVINTPSASGTVTTIMASAIGMDQITRMLRGYSGRTVIDKTSVMGLFDFRLQFTNEEPTAKPDAQTSLTDPSAPSLLKAVEEQLGLKLESARGPVEVLVVDSVSKPTEN